MLADSIGIWGTSLGGGIALVLQSGYSYFNQMPGNVLLVLRQRAASD